MRLFIAIDIPAALKEELGKVQKEIRSLPLRPVSPDGMHLTLKFLGEVEEERLDELKQRLSGLRLSNPGQSRFSPFLISSTSFGTFSHVFWLGVSAPKELLELQDAVEASCLPFAPREPKKFKPHLTIARFNDPQLERVLKERFAGKKLEVSWTVDSFVLYQSTLTPQGPRYEELARF